MHNFNQFAIFQLILNRKYLNSYQEILMFLHNKRLILSLIILFKFSSPLFSQNQDKNITGAWKSDNGVLIITENYFSYALFDKELKEFNGTYGGKWMFENDAIIQILEYSTFEKPLHNTKLNKSIHFQNNKLSVDDESFVRIDDGQPGKLEGAWLFSGRKRDNEVTTRNPDQPRKTMKILSGSRFQWIAYNTETKAFFGTGGGIYTTVGSQYTEHIEFFSRDSSRVGASLSFNFEIKEGIWNHSGLNSRGEPLYEFWSLRQVFPDH